MIARTRCAVEEQPRQNQPLNWQDELSRAIRSPAELLERLQLPTSLLPAATQASQLFPLRVPVPFLERIQKGNERDPLLLQVLPLHAESQYVPGYVTDPLEEKAVSPKPGVLHKYQGRALLIVSGACAVNCRYCFRRHFPYGDNNLSTAEWQQSLEYIAQDASIDEVILSGGDPLAASDKRLAWLVDQIEQIPHVERLRIHTRLPVVIPQRVNPSLLDWLSQTRLQKVMVVHINHPNELDASVANALKAVTDAGVMLLNQAVLLREINDQVTILETLSKKLFAAGILPYYLHLLDPVQGAAHFNVPENEAKQLINELTARLPGYLVPKLVREEPGKASKSSIAL